MIIDIHTHVYDLRGPDSLESKPVTWNSLVERLDEEGIDKAVVLPLGISPEILLGPSLLSQGNDLLSQISPPEELKDRVIIFGNLDPRMGCQGNLTEETVNDALYGKNGNSDAANIDFDYSWILKEFLKRGCLGIGEVTANLAQDDPRVINMFYQCGKYQLPVVFHTTGPGKGVYGLFDEPGLPRLERLLKTTPETICIAHATGIWAEIDGNVTLEDKFIYPKRKIKKRGRLLDLLEKYPNLYVDISGNSGFNALTRDRDFGIAFLNEFRKKVLFGSDVCFADNDSRMPHLDYLRRLREEGALDEDAFSKITGENALRLFKI